MICALEIQPRINLGVKELIIIASWRDHHTLSSTAGSTHEGRGVLTATSIVGALVELSKGVIINPNLKLILI